MSGICALLCDHLQCIGNTNGYNSGINQHIRRRTKLLPCGGSTQQKRLLLEHRKQ